MRDAPVTTIISALGDIGRPAMLTIFSPDSCIAATAIVCETLRAYGLDSMPLVVETRIFNPTMAAWVWAGQRGEERSPTPPPGSHEVDLGLPDDPPTGKELHLVALAPRDDGGGWLVDLSVDQAARPDRGLDLEPASFEVNADSVRMFLAGAPKAWQEDDGVLYAYRVRSGVRWWRASPNFGRRDAALRAHVVGAVIRAIDAGYGRSDA